MSSSSSLVVFNRAASGIAREEVRAFARVLRDVVACGSGFCCRITGDRELKRLNREFRDRDEATDVLSFPALPPPAGAPEPPFLGDLAISLPRAAEQARERGHVTEREIEILMLHGVLHLLGMDHETDRGRMRRAERQWRIRLGLPAGLIERVRG